MPADDSPPARMRGAPSPSEGPKHPASFGKNVRASRRRAQPVSLTCRRPGSRSGFAKGLPPNNTSGFVSGAAHVLWRLRDLQRPVQVGSVAASRSPAIAAAQTLEHIPVRGNRNLRVDLLRVLKVRRLMSRRRWRPCGRPCLRCRLSGAGSADEIRVRDRGAARGLGLPGAV